jgi:hypothetical protein
MRISRYIKFPLIFAIIHSLVFPLLGWSFVSAFIYGAIFGLVIQFYSDYRTRKALPGANEEDFGVRQKRNLVLFCDYDQAFDLCLESINYLRKGKLKDKNYLDGIIKAKTGMSWQNWGNKIDFRIIRLTENTTEIEIMTTPVLWTTQVDFGEGLKALQTLKEFFDNKNEEINRQLVAAKYEGSINAYTAYQQNVEIENK